MPAVDFARRSERRELMDEEDLAADVLHPTLDELETINRLLGGYRPSIAGVASLLPADSRGFTLLDVGTGSGDTPRRIAAWARRRGLAVEIDGIDLSPVTTAYARKQAGGDAALRFHCRDLEQLPRAEPWDIVHAALVLHHFPGAGAVRALKRMYELSRWGVVINDLHRHPLAFHSIRALSAALSSSTLIRNDAPLSVLRAFRRAELIELVRAAGLPEPRIEWRWAFRWQLVVPRGP